MAKRPVIDLHLPKPYVKIPAVSIEVLGNLVAVVLMFGSLPRVDGVRDEVHVYNWMTGERLVVRLPFTSRVKC